MIGWYYVKGTERVGPVGIELLRDLMLKEEINLETYIWRKGFQNWERLKDVSELDLSSAANFEEPKAERRIDKVAEKIEVKLDPEEASPEITFNFDWKSVRYDEELFFIKIGHDRKAHIDTDLFGPYSLNELNFAINEKRINYHTLIFTAGMPGWIEVGETPLDPKNLTINTDNILDEAPLLIVIGNDPIPLIALMQKAGTKECTLLGSGPFQVGKFILCTMYSGTAVKAKNLKLKVEDYLPREQKVLCSVIEINDNAKKIMQNYAD